MCDEINVLVNACMKIEELELPGGYESSAWLDLIGEQQKSRTFRTTEKFSRSDDTRDYMIDQYGSLFVNPKLSTCPKSLKQYMRLSRAKERLQSDRKLLLALSANVDRSSDSEAYKDLCKAKQDMDSHLTLVSRRNSQTRDSCWKEGFDLSFIDDVFVSGQLNRSRAPQEAQEALPETWNSILRHIESAAWVTKKDRINAWLLRNLAVSPEEAALHCSYLFKGRELSGDEWSRLVLKYWSVDEAATGPEMSECSTDDVERSSLIQYSEDLHTAQLPIHKKRSLDSDLASWSDQAPRKRARMISPS